MFSVARIKAYTAYIHVVMDFCDKPEYLSIADLPLQNRQHAAVTSRSARKCEKMGREETERERKQGRGKKMNEGR